MESEKLKELQKKRKDLNKQMEVEFEHGCKLSSKLASLESKLLGLEDSVGQAKENREKGLSDLAVDVIDQKAFDQIEAVYEKAKKAETTNSELAEAVKKAIENSQAKIERLQYEAKRLENQIWSEAFNFRKAALMKLIGDEVREVFILGEQSKTVGTYYTYLQDICGLDLPGGNDIRIEISNRLRQKYF